MKNLFKLILISLTFEAFSDDLLSIYNEALDKDPEFNSKKADLAISKEFLNQSRSNLLPQVRVTGGTNWNEYYQDRELQNDYNTFSYGLNISQPLFRLDKWFSNKQAKENLEAHQSDYRVVYEDSLDEAAKILVPDPNWMACALQGGILPPVEVYWELAKDEAEPDFKKHTRGYLLHESKPVDAMTEEQAIEYLIMKDCPQSVWKSWDEGNRPKMVICKKEQLPATREWRNAWRISDDLDLAA